MVLLPIFFTSVAILVGSPRDSLPTKGYKAGEVILVNGCRFRFPRASVVETGEGTGTFFRIYPRLGEDYFFTIRGFPRPIPPGKEPPTPEEENIVVNGNSLFLRTLYIPEGNLVLYQAVRQENLALLEFFLSCEPN